MLNQLAAPVSFTEVPGFDPRQLVKLEVDGLSPDDLQSLPGVTVVMQEDKAVLVAFIDEPGRLEFEARLQAIARGGKPARRDVLLAIRAIRAWGPEDRIGVTLRGAARAALDGPEPFVLDVELWPLEHSGDRRRMVDKFVGFCRAPDLEFRDKVERDNVVIVRVRATPAGAQLLLGHRDVRFIDLPPSFGLRAGVLTSDVSQFPAVIPPAEGAPRVAILDSGVLAGHPLVGPAFGEGVSFLPGLSAPDESGHGTMVGGIALYGDVAGCIEARAFQPRHWLFSGRVLNALNETDQLIEKQIVEAVEYFTGNNNRCRIFNLSIGDEKRPFNGARPGPWAVLLDELAKKHDVIFIVSSGNFRGSSNGPSDWRREYPRYLLEDPEARIIDPAPAVNAITVGGIAEYEQSRTAQRNPNDPAHQPVARRNTPSPFTRSGFGVSGAIKPELVEHAGNAYVDAQVQPHLLFGQTDIGVVSTSHRFAEGRLFSVDSGTSFAAPRVASLAARILAERPAATNHLVRALIAVHAAVPTATRDLLADDESILRLAGYGRPNPALSLDSSERCVTLFSEEELGEDKLHFYEVPIPEDFTKPPVRRLRRISVALSYTAAVRSTRRDYRASVFSFRMVRAKNLDAVVKAFKKVSADDEGEDGIPEIAGVFPKFSARRRGTLQAATWPVKMTTRQWSEKKLFIVVTRQVRPWARGQQPSEKYALAVALEDSSNTPVQLHTQIRLRLQQRVRVRVQP